ncbi:MAG: exodeoxyribonuclease VII large subunit [Planctomycetota bacterium]|jgi:exodeoxyribonuclease VII large subunit
MSNPSPKSVSQLTHEIKELLEGTLSTQWVAGEVSNCRPARSGHVYFTLKDEHSQISAVMWRSTAQRLGFELRDGQEIVAVGRVEVYAPRGSYQLIVQQAIPQGMGALELKLRQLKEKLAAEGLFEQARKRPIPRLPKRIALVTSPTGAAVRDMLQVITRRWPNVNIVIVPVAVQGARAAPEIAAALRKVASIPEVDVVITGRGGGSLEDLWAFNEEIVARAIAACPIPVISAVGHEIDVSISDLVADVRALTPSEAGELVVPIQAEYFEALDEVRNRLVNSLKQRAVRARMQLDALASRRVFTNPTQRIHQLEERIDELNDRLTRAVRNRVETSRNSIARLADSLNSLSPLGVLARGYSMTFQLDKDDTRGALVTDASDTSTGDRLLTYLNAGRVISRVEEIEEPTVKQDSQGSSRS